MPDLVLVVKGGALARRAMTRIDPRAPRTAGPPRSRCDSGSGSQVRTSISRSVIASPPRPTGARRVPRPTRRPGRDPGTDAGSSGPVRGAARAGRPRATPG